MLLHTGLAPANCEHHISTYLGQVSPGATCHVSGAHIAIIVITSSPQLFRAVSRCKYLFNFARFTAEDRLFPPVVDHAAGLAAPQL